LADAARRLVGLDSLRADTRFGKLDGRGMSVVIIDTGLDVDHPFFGADRDGNGVADRILYQYDFADGDADAGDTSGHGTHVSSIIASQDPAYPGIAPGVGIIHLKVFSNGGRGNFGNLEKALQWVIDQSAARNIAAVNLSLGDGQNWSQAVGLYGITDELDALDRLGVITVAAAGNSFATFGGAEGLAYPAADPNVISVGAVWDADRGRQDFGNLGIDLSTAADRIAGFSQRDRDLLDGLAPGALITAAANGGGVATMRGTSMAAPFVTGAAVLAQQLATERYGARLNTAQFRELLQRSAVRLIDGDDEQTNVPATGATYHRLDLMSLADSLWIAGPPKTADANPGNAGNGNGSIGTLNGAFAYFVQLAQGQDREGIDFGIRPIPQPPPKVTASVVQGGMSQRSFVDRVEIDFSTRVNLDDLIRSGAITSAVSLVNLGITADSDPDQSVPLNANQFRYEFDATSGRSRLTWSLDAFSNATQSLPNGFYRLRLATSMITDADGQPLVGNQGSADFDITFLRLQGDADGTGRVNNDDMTMVNRALNATPASSSWNANADLDRDGRVTVRDRVLVARATGSSITPPALGSGLGVSSLDAPPEIALSWLDLNRDGIVSALDALRVINHFHQAAYPIAPTAEITDSAMDLDFDGEFDLDDAGQVLRHLADRSGTKSLAFDLALSQQPDWHPGDWLD
jgi:subtilisin family serine protease